METECTGKSTGFGREGLNLTCDQSIHGLESGTGTDLGRVMKDNKFLQRGKKKLWEQLVASCSSAWLQPHP